MPRPKNGYRLKDGTKVPGVTDITDRYQDTKGLQIWANQEGLAGRKLWAKREEALTAGTIIHGAAEMSLMNRPHAEIIEYINRELTDQTMRDNARKGFEAFEEFRASFAIRAYKREISLVSETHKYGGTLDIVAHIGNALGIVDLKSCKDKTSQPYPNMLEQLAGYRGLWDENFPSEKLNGGYHLILLPKDGSPFKHFYYRSLRKYWSAFLRHRECWDLDIELKDLRYLAGENIANYSQREFRRAEAPKIEPPHPATTAWLERCRLPAA